MRKIVLLFCALFMSMGFAFAQYPTILATLGLPTSDGPGNGAKQQGWLVSGMLDKINTAKYLVLETNGAGG